VVNRREYYKGRGESCESMYVCGSSVHQKCYNYGLTNLFGLCRFVWIIDSHVICPSPHHGALARPSTFEMLWTRECISTLSFVVFTFGLTFESFKECGVHHQISFAHIHRGPSNESFASHFRFKRCICWEEYFSIITYFLCHITWVVFPPHQTRGLCRG
jgi:hypothetical protein